MNSATNPMARMLCSVSNRSRSDSVMAIEITAPKGLHFRMHAAALHTMAAQVCLESGSNLWAVSVDQTSDTHGFVTVELSKGSSFERAECRKVLDRAIANFEKNAR